MKGKIFFCLALVALYYGMVLDATDQTPKPPKSHRTTHRRAAPKDGSLRRQPKEQDSGKHADKHSGGSSSDKNSGGGHSSGGGGHSSGEKNGKASSGEYKTNKYDPNAAADAETKAKYVKAIITLASDKVLRWTLDANNADLKKPLVAYEKHIGDPGQEAERSNISESKLFRNFEDATKRIWRGAKLRGFLDFLCAGLQKSENKNPNDLCGKTGRQLSHHIDLLQLAQYVSENAANGKALYKELHKILNPDISLNRGTPEEINFKKALEKLAMKSAFYKYNRGGILELYYHQALLILRKYEDEKPFNAFLPAFKTEAEAQLKAKYAYPIHQMLNIAEPVLSVWWNFKESDQSATKTNAKPFTEIKLPKYLLDDKAVAPQGIEAFEANVALTIIINYMSEAQRKEFDSKVTNTKPEDKRSKHKHSLQFGSVEKAVTEIEGLYFAKRTEDAPDFPDKYHEHVLKLTAEKNRGFIADSAFSYFTLYIDGWWEYKEVPPSVVFMHHILQFVEKYIKDAIYAIRFRAVAQEGFAETVGELVSLILEGKTNKKAFLADGPQIPSNPAEPNSALIDNPNFAKKCYYLYEYSVNHIPDTPHALSLFAQQKLEPEFEEVYDKLPIYNEAIIVDKSVKLVKELKEQINIHLRAEKKGKRVTDADKANLTEFLKYARDLFPMYQSTTHYKTDNTDPKNIATENVNTNSIGDDKWDTKDVKREKLNFPVIYNFLDKYVRAQLLEAVDPKKPAAGEKEVKRKDRTKDDKKELKTVADDLQHILENQFPFITNALLCHSQHYLVLEMVGTDDENHSHNSQDVPETKLIIANAEFVHPDQEQTGDGHIALIQMIYPLRNRKMSLAYLHSNEYGTIPMENTQQEDVPVRSSTRSNKPPSRSSTSKHDAPSGGGAPVARSNTHKKTPGRGGTVRGGPSNTGQTTSTSTQPGKATSHRRRPKE